MRGYRSGTNRHGWAASIALVLLGCVLGGCSVPVADLPVVGLPAGTPARPAEQASYPAVHDMPAPRAEPTLEPADQDKMEKDLIKVRDQQNAAAGHPTKAPDGKAPDKPHDKAAHDKAKAHEAKDSNPQDSRAQVRTSSD